MSAYTDDDVQAARDAILTQYVGPGYEDREIASADARMALAAVAPAIAARALREMAERTIAESVCCDEYEHFKEFGDRPKYAHHICYWGAAHAEALRARADEIEAGS